MTHLFGCFCFIHRSRCPHRALFMKQKHLKNLRSNRTNLFFHHHLVDGFTFANGLKNTPDTSL